MFGHRKENRRKHSVIVDMIDFLMTYASRKLGFQNNLAQQIYQAGSQDLQGLDVLFNDNGYGRVNKFIAIGEGAISDSLLPMQRNRQVIQQRGIRLAQQAMNYLGRHENQFNHWLID